MNRNIIIGVLVTVFALSLMSDLRANAQVPPNNPSPWWEVQSIDTVKYSRDLSREKAKNESFDAVIDDQVKKIAKTGSTHVSIGTPYDDEFLPMTRKWVASARKYELNVWFRGNLSGWEGWFNYDEISRDEHVSLIKEFILSNGDLFEDGDIFTACTECENGGPGDPRKTGDVSGHREFLIREFQITSDAFRKIGKNVKSNYNSMNGDVARLIMDRETTRALGGVVVIDHYVATPEKLVKDVREIASRSEGKVVLGEFGAPITDIHGRMTDQMQKDWIARALEKLIQEPDLIGINYWVNMGGTSALWTDEGEDKPSVEVVSFYFQPKTLNAVIVDELDKPIELAKISLISLDSRETFSDKDGGFEIPYYSGGSVIKVSAVGYNSKDTMLSKLETGDEIVLIKSDPGILFKIQRLFHNLLK